MDERRIGMQQSIVSLTLDWYHLFVAYNLGVHNEDMVGLGYGYLKMVVVSIPQGRVYISCSRNCPCNNRVWNSTCCQLGCTKHSHILRYPKFWYYGNFDTHVYFFWCHCLYRVFITFIHKSVQLMSCVHEPSIRFKNKDYGCRNPTTSNLIGSHDN